MTAAELLRLVLVTVVTVVVTLAVTRRVTVWRDRTLVRDAVTVGVTEAVTAGAESAGGEIESLARGVGMLDERGLSRMWETAPKVE